MPAAKIGSLTIVEYESTRSWGVEPGSASGTAVWDQAPASDMVNDRIGFEVGDFVAYTIMGVTFYGYISSFERSPSRESGCEYKFQLVDKRIHLRWAIVFGVWNREQDPGMVQQETYAITDGDDGLYLDSNAHVGFSKGIDFTGGLDQGKVGIESNIDWRLPIGTDNTEVPAPGIALPSLTRGRLFGQILPVHWAAQIITYSQKPKSAARIITEAMAGAIGGYKFALNFHGDQHNPVFNIDANSGVTLASLIQQVADAHGLQVTLDGDLSLRFGRRGEGGPLTIPNSSYVPRMGQAMSTEPTKVRVVGGSQLVQVNEVMLEPDWNDFYSQFVNTIAWLDEVANLLQRGEGSPDMTTSAGRAEIAARAREITLRQYIELADDGDGDIAAQATDNARIGRITRMDMPVWEYIRQFVYRSYRIPAFTKDENGKKQVNMLYGMPIRHYEMHDKLLCAVELTDAREGRVTYKRNPPEFYPEAQSYVAAIGQPLDLLSAETGDAVMFARMTNMRDTWGEIGDYTVDTLHKSIQFSSPVFIDGDYSNLSDASESLFLYPNQGQGGEDLRGSMDPDSPYLWVVKPNPNYKIEPAKVKATFVFKIGIYYKDFGYGARWTTHSAGAVAQHLLHGEDGFSDTRIKKYHGNPHLPDVPKEGFLEVLYEDGRTASEQAETQAAGFILRSGVEQSGEYVRIGAAGTALDGTIDRVSIRFNRNDGLKETVEFSKPRPTKVFISTRDIAERTRNNDLFQGQKELEREVRQLRAIARRMQEDPVGMNNAASASRRDMPDVFSRPAGVAQTDVVHLADPNHQYPDRKDGDGNNIPGWRTGDIVWLDANNLPARDGTVFGGVVVSDSVILRGESPGSAEAASFVTVARNGRVPVTISGPVPGGSILYADKGDHVASSHGNTQIGMLMHADDAPVPSGANKVLAMANLGVGPASKVVPLHIRGTRPYYIPEPDAPVDDPYRRYYVEWGTLNNLIADNWDDRFDVNVTTYFFAKATLRTIGTLKVTSWEIVTGTAPDSEATPDWAVGEDRPAYAVVLLGTVYVDDAQVHSIVQSGGGSIVVGEHITLFQPGDDAGDVRLGKEITCHRQAY